MPAAEEINLLPQLGLCTNTKPVFAQSRDGVWKAWCDLGRGQR